MPGRYAEHTEVAADRSLAEIRRTLQRYGADQFMFGEDDSTGVAIVGFRFGGLQYRMRLEMPPREQFTKTPGGQRRTSANAITEAWEQAKRQRWRALLLKIKAQLEWAEVTGADMAEEFMPYALLPDGSTMGQHAQPFIRRAQETGNMPALIPGIMRQLPPAREAD